VIRSRLRRPLAALVIALGFSTAARAEDSWKGFVGGIAAGFAVHEGSHLALDLAFDAHPRVKGVRFGVLPFFAVTHDSGLPDRRESLISGAGFFSQHAMSEAILSRRAPEAGLSSFEKGAVAFHVATSAGYAVAAFSKYGPYERDTRGLADSLHVDERIVGAFVLAPAVFDTWRYFRPRSRAARWGSRLSKVAYLGLLLTH